MSPYRMSTEDKEAMPKAIAIGPIFIFNLLPEL